MIGEFSCLLLTISEKAIVAPTVPATTMATFAVLGLGIFVFSWPGFGFGSWFGLVRCWCVVSCRVVSGEEGLLVEELRVGIFRESFWLSFGLLLCM